MDKNNSIILHQSYRESMSNYSFPLEFKPVDGRYPLLAISNIIDPNGIFFSSDHNTTTSVIKYKMNMDTGGYQFNYRKQGAIWTDSPMTFYTGYFSVMGLPKGILKLPSGLNNTANYRIYGTPDMFCMGVVPISKLPKVTVSKPLIQRTIRYVNARTELDPETVTILISKEKLRKTAFARETYTITVRNTILKKIEKMEKLGCKIEDVPMDYMDRFMFYPRTPQSNSLVEIMAMESQIKSEVFLNLNKVAV